MQSESSTPPARAAHAVKGEALMRGARAVLLCAIAVVAGMLISRYSASEHNPLRMRSAHAEGSVSAAPGYLFLSMNTGGAAKFYLADTTKQVLCLYEVNGDKLRLVGARKFDYDADIFDGSVAAGKGNRPLEGANGITRVEAKDFAENLQKLWEAGTKR